LRAVGPAEVEATQEALQARFAPEAKGWLWTQPQSELAWLYVETPLAQTRRTERLEAIGWAEAPFTPLPLRGLIACQQHAQTQTGGFALELAQEGARLWQVHPERFEAVHDVALGWDSVFPLIQKRLGLRFATAAEKLFYDGTYDFEGNAQELTAPLAEALDAAGKLSGRGTSWIRVMTLHPTARWLEQGLTLHGWGQPWHLVAAEAQAKASPLGVYAGWEAEVAAAARLDPAQRQSRDALLQALSTWQASVETKPPAVAPVKEAKEPAPPSPAAKPTPKEPALPRPEREAATKPIAAAAKTEEAKPKRREETSVPNGKPVAKKAVTIKKATPPPAAPPPLPQTAVAPIAKKGLPGWLWPALGGGVVLLILVFVLRPKGAEEPTLSSDAVAVQEPAIASTPTTIPAPMPEPAPAEDLPAVTAAVAPSMEASPLPETLEPAEVEATAPTLAAGLPPPPPPSGGIIFDTHPTGAIVRQGDVTLGQTPLTLTDLPVGAWEVTVQMPGYAVADFAAEITDDTTAEPTVLALAALPGNMEVDSAPSGLRFTVSQADDQAQIVAEGRTPFVLESLPVGDYHVAVAYPENGWEPQSQTVTIEPAGTASVSLAFTGGELALNTVPSGATVSIGAEVLGETPLVVENLAPGPHEVTYTREGFEPFQRTLEVVATEMVFDDVELVALERIFFANEIDTPPEVIGSGLELEGIQVEEPAFFDVQFVLTEGGIPEEVRVLESSNPSLHDEIIALFAQQRYTPAQRMGRSVKLRAQVRVNVEPVRRSDPNLDL